MKTINKTIKVLATICAALIIGLHTGMDWLMIFFLWCCLDLMGVSIGD